MTLNEYSLKQSKTFSKPVRILGFQGDAQIIERLKELGFHQGLEIEAVGHAPFGGPQLFRFGNTVLALRLEESSCLLV